jgi:serine/threonine protein phosphatase 1
LLIYAIGDIHGCLSALEKPVKKLPLQPKDELLFLGGYVDKGPQSKEVAGFLFKKPNWRFLQGQP